MVLGVNKSWYFFYWSLHADVGGSSATAVGPLAIDSPADTSTSMQLHAFLPSYGVVHPLKIKLVKVKSLSFHTDADSEFAV
jgi:hypothetical protein